MMLQLMMPMIMFMNTLLLLVSMMAGATTSPAPPGAAKEVVVYATGYNGPIDNGDDWHYFDWSRCTTVVSMEFCRIVATLSITVQPLIPDLRPSSSALFLLN